MEYSTTACHPALTVGTLSVWEEATVQTFAVSLSVKGAICCGTRFCAVRWRRHFRVGRGREGEQAAASQGQGCEATSDANTCGLEIPPEGFGSDASRSNVLHDGIIKDGDVYRQVTPCVHYPPRSTPLGVTLYQVATGWSVGDGVDHVALARGSFVAFTFLGAPAGASEPICVDGETTGLHCYVEVVVKGRKYARSFGNDGSDVLLRIDGKRGSELRKAALGMQKCASNSWAIAWHVAACEGNGGGAGSSVMVTSIKWGLIEVVRSHLNQLETRMDIADGLHQGQVR